MYDGIESVVLGEAVFLGRPLLRWYLAIGLFFILVLVFFTLKIFCSKKYKSLKPKFQSEFSGLLFFTFLLGKLNFYSSIVVSAYIASKLINPIAKYEIIIKNLFLLGLFLQFFIWVNAAINVYAHIKLRNNLERNSTSATAINIFTLMSKVFAFSILFLILLDQMGFNITTLLAGLGVGGIAVALAVQNILGDLFASLTIVFDKPFSVGDVIQVDNIIGRVEKVGLKTTRIRALTGEQIIYSNTDLLKKMLQNFQAVTERRIFFKIGVVYSTPYEKLTQVPHLIKTAIMSQPQTRVDRVHFREYADSSLNYEVSYYILEGDMVKACDIQQEVNFAIFKAFEDHGVSFAFPSRTIYLEQAPPS